MAPQDPDLLARIIECSPAVAFVWQLSDDWPVLYVSKNIDQFGYTGEQFTSGELDYRSIIYPEDASRIATEVGAALATGRTEFDQQYRLVTADGTVRWIRDWTFITQSDGERVAQGIILDITDRIEASKLKDQVFRIAEAVPGALFHHVFYPDGSNGGDYMSPGAEDIWELSPQQLIEQSQLGWDMTFEEDLPDLQASVRQAVANLTPFHHEWRIKTPSGKVKWLSGHGMPVDEGNGVVGSMTVVLDITETKNAQAAVINGLRQTIHALAAVIEARDPYTAGHEDNVAKLCDIIGREMGLDSNTLTGLQLAATVHDIGKISVPAEILSKPGKLTPIEFELVKVHAKTGAELLRPIEFPWPIADIVEQHHERCDGSGYPNGLQCDELLLESKILGAADALEAITNHRPYRPGLGLDVAMGVLRDGAGTAFDADVIDACERLHAQGHFAKIFS